jgi:hypothetical protein
MTDRAESADGLRPDDAFTLLADRTRVEIIRTLGDAAAPGIIETLSFSELRRQTGVSGSSRFNYHLDRLVGEFVERTDEGYRLSYPGVRVYQTIEAGTFTDSHRIDPFELDATCHICGAPQEAAYYDCMFRARCSACPAIFYKYFCPPNSLADRGRVAVLRTANQRIRCEIAAIARDVCPWCAGRMEGRVLAPDAEKSQGDNPAIEHRVLHVCDTCDGAIYTRLGDLLTTHPAVVAFFYDRGVDVAERRLWALPFAASDERTAVTDADPWRATVRVRCDGDCLRVRLDDDPSVVDTEGQG